MSQIHSDQASRSRHTGKNLSAPHLRALRKELLIVRADVERMELAQATLDLRTAVTYLSWLRFIVPGFGSMPWRGRRGSAGGIGALLKNYPLISSIVSLLLAKPIRNSVTATAKPVLKWGSLGLVAWEAYRIYRQIKREAAKPAATSAGAKDADMNPP